jgi:hypothetical protein
VLPRGRGDTARKRWSDTTGEEDGWYNRMNEKGISDLGNKQGSKILGLKHRLEIRSRYC